MRNVLVPWPSPVWWRFWEKVLRRKGFRVTLEIVATSANEAREQAEREIVDELEAKAKNERGDPWTVTLEGVALAEEPVEDSGFKRWFGEEE